jgi:ParB-like chromosome segregation protein Spo0J
MSRRAHQIPSRQIPIKDLRFESLRRKTNGVSIESTIRTMETDLQDRGLRAPLVIVPATKGGYFVIDGYIRTAAAKRCGWKTIPCVVLPSGHTRPVQRELADIITKLTLGLLADHDLARRAIALRENHHIPAAGLADLLGRSRGYTCNLVRWWEAAPAVVRRAWQDKHPLINQTTLERLSQKSREGAAKEWAKILSTREDGESWAPGRRRRARKSQPRHTMEREVTKLDAQVEAAKIRPEVKLFVRKTLGFLLKRNKNVPGVTDKKRGIPMELRT